MKRLVITVLLVAIGSSSLNAAKRTPVSAEVQAQRRADLIALLKQKFPEPQEVVHVAKIVEDPSFALDASIFNGGGKQSFAYLFTDRSVAHGRELLTKDIFLLSEIERRSKIPKEVVVALIMVETQDNPNAGKWPVVTALMTQAIMNPDAAHREKAANWLIVYLRLCKEHKWGPFDQKGSTWGAFGLWQSEPASYRDLALHYRDGKCEKPEGFSYSNPANRNDAYCSIGNYFHGTRFGTSRSSRVKAIRAYNNSERYANAVLKYAETIRHPPNPKQKSLQAAVR